MRQLFPAIVDKSVSACLILLVGFFMACFLRDYRTDERVFNAKIAPSCDVAVLTGTGGFGIFDVDHKKMSTIDRDVFPRCMAISQDSKHIALGLWSSNSCDMTAEAEVQIRRADTGVVVSKFIAHKASVNAVVFSPDSSHLASCGEDGYLKIWNINDVQPVVDRSVHSNGIDAARYSPDGKILAVSAVHQEKRSNIIKLINADTGETVSEIINPEYCFTESLAFSPSGKKLVAVLSVSLIKLWDISDPNIPHLLFSCDDSRCISKGSIWAPGREVGCPQNDGGRIENVTFSPDNASFSAFGYGGILLYSGLPGSVVVEMFGNKQMGNVLDAVFVNNGRTIITAGEDESMRWLDATTGHEINRISGLTLRTQWHWRALFLVSMAWLFLYIRFMVRHPKIADQNERRAATFIKVLFSCVVAFYLVVLFIAYLGSAIQNLPEGWVKLFLSFLIGLYVVSLLLIFASIRYFNQYKIIILTSTLVLLSYSFLAVYMFMEALAAI